MAYLFPMGLRVHVISASNLTSLDRDLPEPYVTVSYDDERVVAKTRISNFSSSPEWDEWLDVPRPPSDSHHLRFSLWDADMEKDDCLGMAEIYLEDGILRYHDLVIKPKPETKTCKELGLRGDLGTLRVLLQEPVEAPPTIPADAGDPVHLTIMYAKNLASTDPNGSADPYVKVFYDSQERVAFVTKSVKGNCPEWQESCTLVPPAGDQKLVLQVWDADAGRHDFMGQTNLLLSANGQQTLPLGPRPGVGEDLELMEVNGTLGSLMVNIERRKIAKSPFTPSMDTMERSTVGSGSTGGSKTTGTRDRSGSLALGEVDFTIVRAIGLAATDRDSADPYVAMQFDGQESIAAKSRVCKKTLRPEWNQPFNFTIPPIEDRHLVMKFIVKDEDLHKEDDFMGMAFLAVGSGMEGIHRLTLLPRPGNRADQALMRSNGNSLGVLEVKVRSKLDKSHPPMHQSGYEYLDVQVLGARGLRTFADPYVALCFGNKKTTARTATHKRDSDPIWNETFHMIVPPEDTMLTIRVMDYDGGSYDELYGEARVRIKGNCKGEHELVLACRGKDARQELGWINVRISGKRIYDFDDDEDYDFPDLSRRQSTHIPEDAPEELIQPISHTIVADNDEERTRRLAEMWRSHEATDVVVVAHPLSSALAGSEDARKKLAYDQHRKAEEEAERLRAMHERQAQELALQMEKFERQEKEDERRRDIERRRRMDLQSYERISLRLGGANRSQVKELFVVQAGGRGRSRYSKFSPAGYVSPYNFRRSGSATKPKPKPKPKAKTPAKMAPAGNYGITTVGGPGGAVKVKPAAAPAPPIMLRDSTSLNQPSYCKVDYYLDKHPTDIAMRMKKAKGLDFNKMSTGKRTPLLAPVPETYVASQPVVYDAHPYIAPAVEMVPSGAW